MPSTDDLFIAQELMHDLNDCDSPNPISSSDEVGIIHVGRRQVNYLMATHKYKMIKTPLLSIALCAALVSCAGNNHFGNRRLPPELTYELTSTVVGHHPDNPLTWYDPVHKVVVGSHLQYRAVFIRVSNPTDQPLTVDADRTGIQVGNVAEPVLMMSTEYYLRCINPAVFPRRYVIPTGGRIDLAIVPFSNFRYNPPRDYSEYDNDHPAPTLTTPPSSGTFREKMDLQRGRCDWSRLYRLPPWHKCDEQCVRDFIRNLEGREIRVSLGMERWGEPFSVDYLMRLGKPRIGVNAKPVPPTKPDYSLE